VLGAGCDDKANTATPGARPAALTQPQSEALERALRFYADVAFVAYSDSALSLDQLRRVVDEFLREPTAERSATTSLC
jgi:uncharacterized iron-regulated protein